MRKERTTNFQNNYIKLIGRDTSVSILLLICYCLSRPSCNTFWNLHPFLRHPLTMVAYIIQSGLMICNEHIVGRMTLLHLDFVISYYDSLV